MPFFGEFDRDSLYKKLNCAMPEGSEQVLRLAQNSDSPIIEQIWSLYEEAIEGFYHMGYYGMVINAHQAYRLASGL